MAIITPTRIKYGWQVTQDDLTFDAENPRFDRGAIRTILTVRNCTVLYYRDIVNLTSAHARAKVIRILAEKEVTFTEDLLIALDEACRQRSTPAPEKHVSRGGDSDVSEKGKYSVSPFQQGRQALAHHHCGTSDQVMRSCKT
jgi:hypothetical protein